MIQQRCISIWSRGLCWSVVLLLAGCGGAAEELPTLTPVSGTVTLDGQPTAGIAIVFQPRESGEQGPQQAAFAATNAEGKYELQHRSGSPGAEAGEYVVTFSRFLMPDGSSVPAGTEPAAVGAKESLPHRYTQADRTTESATVGTTAETIDFALQSR